MKIATIAHDTPAKMHIEAIFKEWSRCALSVFKKEDIVLMLEEKSPYKDLWPQIVELKPLKNFTPRNAMQHYVYSDYYKSQGFHLIGEPVLVIDLDCIVQGEITDWDDNGYRLAQHNPGTGPDVDVVGGKVVPHMNCAVQYQGFDCYDRFVDCMDEVRTIDGLCCSWMLGEISFSLLFQKLKNEGVLVEELPLKYSWFAVSFPYPDDVKILHYGQNARSLLLDKLGIPSYALKKPPIEDKSDE